MDNLGIIGTGGFAREVAFLALDILNGDRALFHKKVRFIVSSESVEHNELMGLKVVHQKEVDFDDGKYVVAIGDPRARERVVKGLPETTKFETLVHPSAHVSPWVKLGPGTIICAGCILTVDVETGSHAQLNLKTSIGHDTRMGDYFTSAPGVSISGLCDVGDRVYFGTNAGVRQQIRICSDATIGMGAMVTSDLSIPGTYVGIPAKLLQRN